MDEKEKVQKPEKKEAVKERRTISAVAGDYKGEFQKIIWLSKEELIKQTFTVIVTSLMVGAIIASMDYIFQFLYKLFVNFFV